MRRHPFETYLDKVFDFSSKVGALPDSRQSPRHNGKKVFDAVFLGSACQFPSVHRIETECKSGALAKRIGFLSEDAIGYALERQDSGAIFTLGCDLARQLKRNGIFRSDWSRGLVVAAVDRMEICSSFARSCDLCLANCYEGPFLPLIALRESDEFHFRNGPGGSEAIGSGKCFAIGKQ